MKKNTKLVARRLTDEEKAKFNLAFTNTFGKRGRPSVSPELKKKPVSIKLEPSLIKFYKAQAEKKGIGYQTLIGEVLKKQMKKVS